MNKQKRLLRDAWHRSSPAWRAKQEDGFAEGLLDSDLWIESGDKILRVADLARPSLDTWWKHIRNRSGSSQGEYVADVYYMLLGLASENYLKAMLVQWKAEQLKLALEKSRTLPRELRPHALTSMAEELTIPLEEEEAWLLEILEAHVIWAGRYPFPAKPSDSEFGTGIDSRDWVARARALALRLRASAVDFVSKSTEPNADS